MNPIYNFTIKKMPMNIDTFVFNEKSSKTVIKFDYQPS